MSDAAPKNDERLDLEEARDIWPALSTDEKVEAFQYLPRHDAEDLFLGLSSTEQAEIICGLPSEDRRSWIRMLAPDDAADCVQSASVEMREALIGFLDDKTKHEVLALLAYAEDEAGGLMSPRYARIRADLTVDEAISYLRRQARDHLETIYYVYVHDEQQRLIGVLSFREIFRAPPQTKVRDIMRTDLVSVPEDMDQEQVSRVFLQSELIAVPVVDKDGHMKGIVTLDDIVDVVEEEATEDIQKLGGTAALDAPYLSIGLWSMIRKRGVWLAVLFLGEMLTASAMAHFEDEIARAVVLAVFIPLIISSGGNSGSQATTLVIRAMALGEVGLGHWFTVIKRELAAGVVLGSFLGSIGLFRVALWEKLSGVYGPHWLGIGLTVAISLLGVVLFGTVAGSMLPLLLRRLGLDPASASAPFVATLVDVSGLVIYFSVASALLSGTLL